jgi:hypothetical protein
MQNWFRGDGAKVWDVPDASAFGAIPTKIMTAAGKDCS